MHPQIAFHWDDPYIGSNSYDSIGTEAGFKVVISGGGGDNAAVTFTVTGK